MKIKVFTALAVFGMLISGCAGENSGNIQGAANNEPAADTREDAPRDDISPINSESGRQIDFTSGLTHDIYSDIEMTASVTKDTVTAGDTVPVTVTISNTGDKTIAYTHGPGSFQTPEALHIRAQELQPILYEDWVSAGSVTSDYQAKELAPGESLNFTVHVRAIEPHISFDEYTRNHYAEHNSYIGDTEWEELHDIHNELTAVKAGSYTGNVYFRYYVLEEGGEADISEDPTGYARAEFTVRVEQPEDE